MRGAASNGRPYRDSKYIRTCPLIHTHLIWKFDVSKLKEILTGSANSKDMDDILTKDEHETIGVNLVVF